MGVNDSGEGEIKQGVYFTGHSLTLDGSIGVNFFVELTSQERSTAVVDFFYIVNGVKKTSSVEMKDAGYTTHVYMATCSVCAPEMADTVTATLSINGKVTETDRYSVMAYANEIIANKDGKFSETLITLVKTMLNYGAATQVQFADEHPNTVFANEGVNYDLAALSSAELSALNSPKPVKETLDSKLSGSGLTYYGYTMLLYSKTTLRFYFLKESPTTDISKLSIGGVAAKNYNDYFAYVEVSNIASKNLSNAYTISYDGTSLGSYSPMTYVQDVLQNSPEDTTLCNTVTAM